jgi:hypothetical protein
MRLPDVKSHLAIHRSPPESSFSQRAYNYLWVDLLLSLLAHSVPILARLSAEDTLAILSQSNYSSTHMVGAAYLGVGQSASK